MKTYTIYLGATPIANVAGTREAWTVYLATVNIAHIQEKTADLVWDETGEIVDHFPEWDEDPIPADIDDECGYDPYMGCFTGDC